MKKWIWVLLKAGVSLLLLSILFTRVEMDQLLGVLRRMDLRYLLVALGLYLVFQVLCAFRWMLFAQPLGFQDSFKRFVYYYYAGMFFNLFLPTAIGGDISRCYYLARGEPGLKKAVISVLADRGIGFVALFFILAVALLQSSGMLFSEGTRLGVLSLAVLLALGLMVPFFFKGIFMNLQRAWMFPLVYWQRPMLLFVTLLLSVLFQLIVIGAHMLIGLSLTLEIPWDYYLIFPLLAAAASMLPVTLSGLGIREGTYVLLLSKVGIPWESGLAFALGWLVVILSASLVGGVVWISKPFSWRKEHEANKQPESTVKESK